MPPFGATDAYESFRAWLWIPVYVRYLKAMTQYVGPWWQPQIPCSVFLFLTHTHMTKISHMHTDTPEVTQGECGRQNVDYVGKNSFHHC